MLKTQTGSSNLKVNLGTRIGPTEGLSARQKHAFPYGNVRGPAVENKLGKLEPRVDMHVLVKILITYLIVN